MSDLIGGSVGPEASYDLKLESGKLVFGINYAGAETSAALSVSLDAGVFMDKLKGLIPGQIDDAVLDLLKSILIKM